MYSAVAFGFAFVVSFVLTYIVRGLATRMGIVDRPDGVRRMHDRPIPRAGGVAIFLGVALVMLGLLAAPIKALDLPGYDLPRLGAILFGGAVIFALGLLDDMLNLRARTKFVVEIAVAATVFYFGVRIDGFGLAGGGGVEFPLFVSLLVTVFWIVGISNAFNLIDGSDGLAGGAAVFAAGSMAIVSLLNGNALGAVLSLALAGATMGFLFFNFPPASIFLGDSGSLFLGFTLAGLGVYTTQTVSATFAVAIPVVAFGLPILDTMLAMTRRFLRGQPIFSPDRGHIHHRLRDLGHSPRRIALLLYAVCAGFSTLALLLLQPPGATASILLIAAGVTVWVGVQRLHIPELLEVRRLLQRGILQRSVIAHNVRVRQTVWLLKDVDEPGAMLTTLIRALEPSEFRRVEFWLPADVAAPVAGQTRVLSDGDGYRWSWSNPADSGDNLWEIRLPFRDERGQVIGRLSLWHPQEGEPLCTDVRLVVSELLPEILRTLERLRGSEIVHEVTDVCTSAALAEPAATG